MGSTVVAMPRRKTDGATAKRLAESLRAAITVVDRVLWRGGRGGGGRVYSAQCK